MGTKLVMGASGYLGSHVVQQLVERGDDVRVWVRPSSSSTAFDGLPVERFAGELFDDDAVRAAMQDVETIFYCIVDTRAHLRDPAPLFRTNVEALRHVLDAAVAMRVPRLVFCSTIGTIAVSEDGPATEDLPHNWKHLGGPYIQSRVDAEDLVLEYHRTRGLAAVVLNPANTFGPGDYGPSLHGSLVRAATRGQMPMYVRGQAMESVGVEDAARAFLLAEERGRPGERYILSERMLTSRQILSIAAEAVGVRPPRVGVPLGVMKLVGLGGDVLGKMFKRDARLTTVSVRLMHYMSPLDTSKARRELGWEPSPTPDAIRAQAQWFAARDAARAAARA